MMRIEHRRNSYVNGCHILGMDGELKTRIVECLHDALEADDHAETRYHIRQALQLIDTNGTETTTE